MMPPVDDLAALRLRTGLAQAPRQEARYDERPRGVSR
jgi:hypothetical protein